MAQPAERVTERCVNGEALKSIDGIKEGEALNNNCGDVEGTLQPNQVNQLISDFNRALNEFETKKKSIHIGNPSTLPFTELITNKSEEHIWDLPGGLVMTHEFGLVNMVNIHKEKSATTTMKGNEPDQSDQPPHRAIWKPPPWPILKVTSDNAIFWEQKSVDVVLDIGGGLVLFWRSTIDVIVEGLGTNYINTMFQEEDWAGIGVIIRECHGKGLAHMVGIIPLPLPVIDLETLAILKAL